MAGGRTLQITVPEARRKATMPTASRIITGAQLTQLWSTIERGGNTPPSQGHPWSREEPRCQDSARPPRVHGKQRRAGIGPMPLCGDSPAAPSRAAASSILRPCSGAGERPSFRARNWCRAGRRSARPAAAARGPRLAPTRLRRHVRRPGGPAALRASRRPPPSRNRRAPKSLSCQTPAGLG